jgi:hypothetical protein
MMLDTLPSLRDGRQVLSNVPLLLDGEPHPLYVPLTSYEQLLTAEHCDVLLDEIASIASSRDSSSMPAPVVNVLQQLRKPDVIVRWTAPSFARGDKVLRECSQAITLCKGFAPRFNPETSWPERRLFWWRTYDAMDYVDFTARPQDRHLHAIARQWFWRPGHPVDRLYDTTNAVSYMGMADTAGKCYRCGGRRTAPRCSCDSPGTPAELTVIDHEHVPDLADVFGADD